MTSPDCREAVVVVLQLEVLPLLPLPLLPLLPGPLGRLCLREKETACFRPAELI